MARRDQPTPLTFYCRGKEGMTKSNCYFHNITYGQFTLQIYLVGEALMPINTTRPDIGAIFKGVLVKGLKRCMANRGMVWILYLPLR